MATIDDIRSALSQVAYPGFTKDIVSFGFVKDIKADAKPYIQLEITASSDEIASILKEEIKNKLAVLGILDFDLKILQPSPPKETSSKGKNMAPYIKNFIMVSSGKGGVGKSTITTNLAIALAMQGKKIGVLDADIYGPNIPRMFGVVGVQPEVVANRVKPIQALGCEVMSMGVLMEEGQSLIWRGPMIMKVIQQLLTDIEWGELDGLIIDMPPGTGDAQLTLAQSVPVTCGVVVTTPQTVALDDAKRSLDMFEKLHIPLGGIVENMSGFICPESQKEYDIFGKGTAVELAKEYKTEVIAQIPIEVDTRKGGDEGKPITYYAPTSESAKRFLSAAATLWAKIEDINKDGGTSNEAIQPTIGLDGKSSACSAGGDEDKDGGCGCH